MKSTVKWYAHRAAMLLGTFAAFAFVVGESAKRW
jgi:hypothetical protein